MNNIVRKIGWILLVIGILMLLTGLILAMTMGTVAVPILLSSSILVNAVAITILTYQKP